MLRRIFFPWVVISEQKDTMLLMAEEIAGLRGALSMAKTEAAQLRAQLDKFMGLYEAGRSEIEGLRFEMARFDHDGDGKPGGSRKRKQAPSKDQITHGQLTFSHPTPGHARAIIGKGGGAGGYAKITRAMRAGETATVVVSKGGSGGKS